MANLVNQDVIKEEVRNSLGGNVIFIEDGSNTSEELVTNLVDRYFGRGELKVVESENFYVIANIKGALFDEYIVSVGYYDTIDSKLDLSKIHYKYYVITAEMATDSDGERRIKYSCVEVDENLRAGTSELRAKDVQQATAKSKVILK